MTLQPRRHYGDPAAEYRAAVDGCGVVVRGDRRLLRVSGRAPVQMLNGILTSRIPAAPVSHDRAPVSHDRAPVSHDRAPVSHDRAPGPEILAGDVQAPDSKTLLGDAVYGAILTVKGRMVTDVVTVWLGAGEEEGLGLSVAEAAHEAVLAHFRRFLPPRLARFEDLGPGTRLLTLVGPGAGEAVGAALGGTVLAATVGGPRAGVVVGAEPESGFALLGGGPLGGGVLVARGVRQVPSWDVWVGSDAVSGVWERLREHGAVPVGAGVWHTLRVESGFPEFGIDMDDGTIPVEAGLVDVAFDHGKGCYTGQEVIVRIRHRGRVNWHLRALRFGDSAARPGMHLFDAGGDKVRGRVTSVADSPRFGQVIGLGYVRREVEPPATLRLGSGEGAEVGVEGLGATSPTR